MPELSLRYCDLSQARVLITNDDGIHAPGIAVLERIACSLAKEVIVVAPEVEQSAASHALTVRRPLRVRPLDRHHFAIDGTPADCVLLAVEHILRGEKPDLVLSGINAGLNLGSNIIYSGTVAAAMEAALLDIPAVAFSQECNEGGPDFTLSEAVIADLLTRIARLGWPPASLYNVNIPAGKIMDRLGRFVPQGRRTRPLRVIEDQDPNGRDCLWIGGYPNDQGSPETDLAVIAAGGIAITPLKLDLTDYHHIAALQMADHNRVAQSAS